jgi:hypothetical protein
MNSVILDPGKSCFDTEDALCSTLINVIVIDNCIRRALTTKGNISFEVGVDFVLLDMS